MSRSRRRERALRIVLLACGTLFLALGVIGVFFPVMPTTPFLLLAAACFARSSERLHAWLLGHPRLGPYISGFVYGGGVPAHAKKSALRALWLAIALSCSVILWRVEPPEARFGVPVLLVGIALAVSVYIVTRPTAD